jgi:cell wall-associated NlpC family hydrolase
MFPPRLRALVLACGFAVGILVTTATAGYTDPSPAPGDIEAQINATWNQLEPLIEKYNSVHDQYTAMQAKVAGLQAQIQPLQMQVDLAMTRVGAISAQAYMFGPGSKLNAVLSGSTPDQFLTQLTYLDEMARSEAATVADVAALRDKYDQQKRPLDAALATLQQQDDQLKAQRQDIENRLKQLDSMRLAAYGNTGGTGNLRPVACPQVYTGDAGSRAAKYACQQIGKKYVWGAAGPNTFDCSGLTLAAWASVGVTLPHNALAQKQATPRVAASALRTGDLVFYYGDVHHVVIYVGNGWVVSASTYGVPIGMQKLDMARWNSAGRPH